MAISKRGSERKLNFFKSNWWLIIVFLLLSLFIIIIIRKFRSNKWKNNSEEKNILFCYHQFSKEDERKSATRFLTEWECDYCGKVIEWGGSHPNPNQAMTRPILNSLAEKHLKKCEKFKRFISDLDAKKIQMTYDDEKTLKIKGYKNIDWIKNWGLLGRINLPHLEDKKRMGIVKELTVFSSLDKGNVLERLIFILPGSTSFNCQNFSEIFEKGKKPDLLYFSYGGSKNYNLYEKAVLSFFIWRVVSITKVDWNYNVFSSIVNFHKFMPISGGSGTVSFYLSLLSIYYQKPISRDVVATAFLSIGDFQVNYCSWCLQEEIIKDPEKTFSRHKVSLVGDLELKISVVVETGIKKLILSSEQKEDYEKTIPREIKEKLKVYYVKDVEELEKLFWQGEFS